MKRFESVVVHLEVLDRTFKVKGSQLLK